MHPLVIHFWTEHGGKRQDIIIRMTSRHNTAVDRQVTESIKIESRMNRQEELLNLKSEWAGSKLPGLTVKALVGVGKVIELEREGVEGQEQERKEETEAIRRWQEARVKGMKRILYVNERVERNEGEGEGKRKRRRREDENERDPKSSQCLETDMDRTEDGKRTSAPKSSKTK